VRTREPPETHAAYALPAGYGITCVLEGGSLLEKAAANISIIRGTLSAARAQAMSSRGRSQIDPAGGQPYSAAALSLVFHAAHPLVPTLRADVRLFQVGWRCSSLKCDITNDVTCYITCANLQVQVLTSLCWLGKKLELHSIRLLTTRLCPASIFAS
jgi:hypothetical protein